MENFVTGLEPTCAAIKNKCPGMSDAGAQLASSELLAAEILIPGRSTKQEFAQWVSSLTASDIDGVLKRRREFKEIAGADREAMVKAREEERKKREEEIEKMKSQMDEARENRSMVFNEETGRFEEIQVEE